MSNEDFFQSIEKVIKEILEADTTDFHELAEIVSLDPSEDFSGSKLSHVSISNAHLEGYDFSEADLTGADLSRSILVNANFRNANLSQANFSSADLGNVDFSGANLSNANFSRADLRGANLRKSRAKDADFSYANLTGVCLEDWDFDGTTQLIGIECEYVYFSDQQQNRCPVRGSFVEGEFIKLMRKYKLADIPIDEQIQPKKDVEIVLSTVNQTINLGKWLKHEFSESLRFGWQMVGVLLEPEQEKLAFAIRSTSKFQEIGVKRTKLIDLGDYAVVLLVAVILQKNKEFQILVQVHPTQEQVYLLPNIQLSLLDESNKVLQEAQSRNRDNYFQLKRFTCPLDEDFGIKLKFKNIIYVEKFEL